MGLHTDDHVFLTPGDYASRRTGIWLTWLSPLFPVWLWHALFDGTPLCRCQHSGQYKRAGQQYKREGQDFR